MKSISLERTSETREIKNEIKSDKKLIEILSDFNENIERINSKFEVVNELQKKGLEEAANDILRSQIVLLMSSIDFYIHEIVKYGVIKIFNKEKARTKDYESVIVSIECVEKAVINPESVDWLEESIIVQNKFKSFISLSKMRRALRIISNKKIMDESIRKTSTEIGMSEKVFKEKLDKLYERRNCIVHQTDRNPLDCRINDIRKEEVQEGITLISKLILNIHYEIKNDI
ncbi:MAG: HEPN domain-containing protein [Clostridium perfringens]|nr:HEPN domain-containing protein [Clostridium perfringens]